LQHLPFSRRSASGMAVLMGEAVAVIAVLEFTMLPPILAHAGLATTDMAAATGAAALYAFVRWLDQGDMARSLVLALTLALAVLSKFSALLMLPACAVALLVWRGWHGKEAGRHAPGGQKQRVLAVGVTVVGACLLVWAGYRFSAGSLAQNGPPLRYQMADAITGRSGRLHDLVHSAMDSAPVPAPRFFRGLQAVADKNRGDPGVYIWGRNRQGQCWYFFPVVLAVKSPLASCRGASIPPGGQVSPFLFRHRRPH
jgi:4-amino-4-deoxy-L-arabinose transferase-like glycosyltransferase